MAMAPADPAVTRTSADVDRYLQAHRRYVHGSALVMPGGFRQVAADAH
jgi:hypothetical protein